MSRMADKQQKRTSQNPTFLNPSMENRSIQPKGNSRKNVLLSSKDFKQLIQLIPLYKPASINNKFKKVNEKPTQVV